MIGKTHARHISNNGKPVAIAAALVVSLLALLGVLIGVAGAQGGYDSTYDVALPRGRIDMLDVQAVASHWGATGTYTTGHTHWGETWTGVDPTLLLSGTANLPILRTYNASTGAAISGWSESGNGVYGRSDSTDTSKAAVVGYSSEHGRGVYGDSVHGYGVYGDGGDEAGDYGGYFVGHGGVKGVGEAEPGGYFESSTGAAIHVGHGGLTSDQYTYLWVPAVTAYVPFGRGSPTLRLDDFGTLEISHTEPTTDSVVIPVTMPSVLYGRDLTIEELYVMYGGDPDEPNTACIVGTRLTIQTGPNSLSTPLSDSTPRCAVTEADYTLSLTGGLGTNRGPILIRFDVVAEEGSYGVRLGPIRLKLSHQ